MKISCRWQEVESNYFRPKVVTAFYLGKMSHPVVPKSRDGIRGEHFLYRTS
jgi:hypothetical protein